MFGDWDKTILLICNWKKKKLTVVWLKVVEEGKKRKREGNNFPLFG